MSELRSQPGTPADGLPAVKLLFDQNPSHRLAATLADVYPGAAHVRDFAMERSDDTVVWAFARDNGFTIVSKDTDFHHLSFAKGAPPRVVWLEVGNCPTTRIEGVLRANVVKVIAFHREPGSAFLILS
jgi:predicted nuclease of predicted toxin-antitoxin system